jgi:peroxiredoxin
MTRRATDTFMTASTYNTTTILLGVAAWLSLGGGLACGVVAVARWKTATRSKWLRRSAALTTTTVALVATHQLLLYKVFLPSLGQAARQQVRERREAADLLKIGDASPDFSITIDDGTTFDIAALRGKVVVVNFFATWCGPCLAELPHVQRLWDQHKSHDDFALLVIGREETAETLSKFKQEQGYSFPMAADPDRKVYAQFAEQYIPRTFVIARDGTIAFATTGFDEEEFAELETLVEERLSKAE